MSEKLWAGRFQKATDRRVDDFHSSLPFDCRLWRQDILGSLAHAQMLGEVGLLSPEDTEAILRGLKGLYADIESGALDFSEGGEDIHMWVETLLTRRIGEAGKRLHTGRSRNDQVALDIRLYARDTVEETVSALAALLKLLLKRAEAEADTVMPGYTHLQKAQPITLGHHLMAYFQMFRRDLERFQDAQGRMRLCPLGAGALATTTYALNRERTAELLGFEGPTENSLDSVSDRDFLIEYLSDAAMTMMHLSRFCEELILWSSHEFGFVEMDDGFSTGSSIMPQKKNPDVAELIRGKTGRVYGDLTTLLSMMKSLPLAYNKDMQEDKEAFFDGRDTLIHCLTVFTGMLETLSFRRERLFAGAGGGFTNATDLADYLVKKGLPFRDAHAVSGKLVFHCLEHGCALSELGLETLQDFCPLFENDVYAAIALETCVAQRALPGGPAPEAVRAAIRKGESWMKEAGL